MNLYSRYFMGLAAILMALAVLLGALGAHWLPGWIPPARLSAWHTGVQYHFHHALGLFAVGFVATHKPESRNARIAGFLLVAGVALFSGSLYAYALSGEKWTASFAPAGGLAMIAGWILLAIALLRHPHR